MTAFPYATVEVVRSRFVESVHAGSAVVLAPSGDVLAAAGDPDAPMLPRSANKPLQMAGMLRAGLSLPPPDADRSHPFRRKASSQRPGDRPA